MHWDSEKNQVFNEKFKSEVFKVSQKELELRLERAQHYSIEERSRQAFGAVFETLAINENLEKHPEGEKQNSIRILIQDLFQLAEGALGEASPSKPDFVSVIFDQQGKLVIDEIVEIKSSVKALNHGITKTQSQPQNTIQTIERIVEILNTLKNTPEESKDVTINNLLVEHNRYQKHILSIAYQRINSLDLTEDISFSNTLRYHIILPAGEFGQNQDFKVVTKDQKPISILIDRSKFSQKDVHKVIDHYAENNIE